MTLISTSRKINSSDELIWSIISDIDKDPDFWHGIKAVKNIQREGNTIERETTISFRHSRCIELVTLMPLKQIATVINGSQEGTVLKQFSTADLPSGIYLVRLLVNGKTATEKLTVIH